ncbi:cell envelope-related function transcriptional attenuator common domain-containing protein [Thalassobacillus cyri]|uniref:Cell envelope-related function transcriptional attenuator common domain-containing protein n=1 Tax=Thalassobacillus cyri TaxID=571932 RepID=A0A1H4DZV2_9BACI|nr:LCP family protein [Thalassobacillus cyri]SEA77712.1 cell envelope-related function transcriptional attenuator common domain-containing protein [Thalassobacillus cyri]
MTSRRARQSAHRKSKKWLKIISLVVLFVILGGGGYAYSIYNNAKQTVDKKMHTPVASIDYDIGKKKVKENKPVNILLMGVDERKNDRGRSDALMVMTLDPTNDRMQLISIPRDTRTTIVGDGRQDKINHAYAFGGTDMAINTVEEFLDIELDYYVSMNMEGLTEMVDAVGGITVNNKLDWKDRGYYKKGYHYVKGEIELDGLKAMGYVRMRYQDPNGDFGRNERQRQVIEGIIDKGANIATVHKIDDILEVLGNNMRTNMAFSDMKNLLTNYNKTRENRVTYQMVGQGIKVNGIYYLDIPENEVQKVHNMIEEYNS